MISQNDRVIFENLFVLELANNHWGNLERGLKIVRDLYLFIIFLKILKIYKAL